MGVGGHDRRRVRRNGGGRGYFHSFEIFEWGIDNIYFLVKVREAAGIGMFSESVAEIRRHDICLYTV